MKYDVGLTYIGRIRSELKELDQCPKQGYEGAPVAWVEIEPMYHDALSGIKPGAKIVILTWLDQADRTVLKVHPRHNPRNPLTGVFHTRSPARPNPIGLHEVRVIRVGDGGVLVVEPMEALDLTPVLDIKISLPVKK